METVTVTEFTRCSCCTAGDSRLFAGAEAVLTGASGPEGPKVAHAACLAAERARLAADRAKQDASKTDRTARHRAREGAWER